MGFDMQTFLLGSQGRNPTDYATPYQNQGQLLGGYTQGSQQAMGQVAPQLDAQQQAQFRQMQMQQAQQLQGIASGRVAGAGELAAQRATQNALAAQQGMAASNRGAYSGMGNLAAARNSAALGLSGAGQGQQAALQDQQMAQGQLAGVLGNARGADIGMAGQNANLQQQQMAQNNQANLGYLNGIGTMDANQLQAQASQFAAAQQNKGAGGGLLTGLGSGLSDIATLMSDERAKTDIKDAGSDIDDMLAKLTAKTYRYKDERHGKGPRAGIMAQDLAKSKAGRAIVVDYPGGAGLKGVDIGKAISAALASSARLDQRLRKVESRRG